MSPFNSRPHKEVDAVAFLIQYHGETFQFTTSQGGRRSINRTTTFFRLLSIHDLTRRSTTAFDKEKVIEEFFQFTTSQGGRQDVDRPLGTITTFQFTTSQGGRHAEQLRPEYICYLSIHDLTRRSTAMACTVRACPHPFNSRPHKEGDVGHFDACLLDLGLSIHDLTRRSTLVGCTGDEVTCNLSIHDLTRRSTRNWISIFMKRINLSIHDLTRRSTY